jgi:hypothetical protein
MIKITFSSLKITLLSLLFIGCADLQKKKNKEIKPNIIIIYTDDLGYGDVSAYKRGTLNTPNIDKLANEGVRFTNG